ncbi:Amino-acid permease [Lachnellula arida]|uniref:Amino-acid permease n=1 Tax=Lachnellula arida TaxID=1316785 RepID=A0A8T9BSA8_9HELO|nr:Amino-acid permease [Lachnellula arida]
MANRRSSLHDGPANPDSALESMGYKSELPRSLSMMSILGLSFAIMAVPFGLSTTMAISLTDGQSVTVLYGWIFVSIISLCIAASLAEICAVFPTAGGVYYWSAMLSTKEYAPIVSWIDGWLGLVGNWTVTLSINFSGAQLILSAISLWNEDFAATQWQTVLMFWAVMAVAFSVNVFGAKYLDLINKICIYWTGASVIIIIVTVLVMSDDRRNAEFVFTHFDASASGWPSGWAWFVGLLQAAYTLTGYGMVASMCEEVQMPEREVPKAMVLSVAAAGITDGYWIAGGGFALLFLILGILFFAGVGALTAASRCTFAFARDGAIPGSSLWARIDGRFNIPLWGLVLSTIVDCILGCIYFGSTSAFNAFTGVATICLSVSYGIPILVSLIRGREAVKHASFSLGKFGFFINVCTIVWISLAIVLFCMPIAIPVTPVSMNYASVVFMGFASISLIWYIISGRKNFKGPPVPVDHYAGQDGQVAEEGIGRTITEDESSSNGSSEKKAPYSASK